MTPAIGRRDAIASLGAFVAAAIMPRRSTTRLSGIGLQLYSVRDAMKADPEGTLAKVRAIGYDDVELLWSFGNFGQTVSQVRATLQRLGLRSPSAHIAPETLLADWQRSLDDARTLGHQYLIVPSLPDETNTSLDAWRRWADHFNAAGRAARASGIWLAFHNEPEHIRPIGGVVPYDLFIERTDPALVRLQLDVGNMLLGGGDPLRYLHAHRDRYWSFHLKDVTADRRGDTELGHGIFDFRSFLAAIPDLARKPCYVEQETADDPLASARRNFGYLRRLEF
ncbi:MAG: sugar phosphate isomerase/epimerase family protein [Gemmatimonadales bacterium]